MDLQEFIERAAGSAIKIGNRRLLCTIETAKRAEIFAQHTEPGSTAPWWYTRPLHVHWAQSVLDVLDGMSTPDGKRMHDAYRTASSSAVRR